MCEPAWGVPGSVQGGDGAWLAGARRGGEVVRGEREQQDRRAKGMQRLGHFNNSPPPHSPPRAGTTAVALAWDPQARRQALDTHKKAERCCDQWDGGRSRLGWRRVAYSLDGVCSLTDAP
ncbi:hypothetical protein E2C01_096677 [Portunus trituberculatus]|uniref:Uncharacterized protein n=1 Tax=Portunus trituberculatus TaxID=210409 RepID=A0A5B7JW93_PORTR|nr:hypothetical protein [Portunus trituberculatus]